MKILHIAPIGSFQEGIGTVLNNLVPLQIELGNDVRIISQFDNHIYRDLPIKTIRSINSFKRYLCNWVPDIVIFHSLYEMIYLSFARIVKSIGIPYCIQMHGALSMENYKKGHIKKLIANILWFNSFIKKASKIIYLNQSEFDKCVVNKLNPSYVIIPNGTNTSIDIDVNRIVNEFIKIIYIGRIDIINKGLDVLVQALKIISECTDEKFKIIFYGSGTSKDVDTFKNCISSISDIAEYKGELYGKEKKECLLSSDMYILTSRSEGMPMGVLEALSHGLPCILTPGTNMTDEIKMFNAGFCTDLDPTCIADVISFAIKSYKNNPIEYRKNAIRLAKKFDWHNIAKESIRMLY